MKKILMNMLTFAVVAAIIVILVLSLGTQEGMKFVYKGNDTHKIIEIKANEYPCAECNMVIENLAYTAQVSQDNGNTYFFDDIGCVVLWLEKHPSDVVKVVTKTLDTDEWVAVKDAWYSRTTPSPMGYGFGAYAKKKENRVSYDEMRLLMLQGKNLHDPFIKKQLLGK